MTKPKETEPIVPRHSRKKKGVYFSDSVPNDEYTEKERKHGVMVNIRMNADQHIMFRKKAAREDTTVNALIRNKLFGVK